MDVVQVFWVGIRYPYLFPEDFHLEIKRMLEDYFSVNYPGETIVVTLPGFTRGWLFEWVFTDLKTTFSYLVTRGHPFVVTRCFELMYTNEKPGYRTYTLKYAVTSALE